jgi:hypothetical protein
MTTPPSSERRIAEAAVRPYMTTPVEIEPDVRSLLTPLISHLVNQVIALVVSAAEECKLSLNRIDVFRFDDPEDNRSYVIVNPWVETHADAAFEYWDVLGDDLDEWVSELPKEQANTFQRKVFVEVRWNDDNAV